MEPQKSSDDMVLVLSAGAVGSQMSSAVQYGLTVEGVGCHWEPPMNRKSIRPKHHSLKLTRGLCPSSGISAPAMLQAFRGSPIADGVSLLERYSTIIISPKPFPAYLYYNSSYTHGTRAALRMFCCRLSGVATDGPSLLLASVPNLGFLCRVSKHHVYSLVSSGLSRTRADSEEG